MFDHYHTHRAYNRTESKTHEHRAPTDASIRLYHEMVQKARSEVLASLVTSNNVLELAAVVEQPMAALGKRITIRYKVNGAVPQDFVFEPTPLSTRHDFADAFARHLAATFLKELLEKDRELVNLLSSTLKRGTP